MIEFYAGFTERGIYTHAVPASEVMAHGVFQSMCHHKVTVHSTSDAWDWDRVIVRDQCVNCRIAIRKAADEKFREMDRCVP